MEKDNYHILSLDGGGSWAILQIMALEAMYPNTRNKDILRKFDLVVANSGGSIVLAGMMALEWPSDVFNLFYDSKVRHKIFYKYWMYWFTKSLIGPRYYTSKKIKGLSAALDIEGKLFGEIPLDKIPVEIGTPDTHYMIMSFDYDKQRAVFFRSDLESPSSSGSSCSVSLAHAIHASSNAPVNFFNKPAEFVLGSAKRRFWDGAVAGNNNPCLVGLVEALNYGVKPQERLRVLSIGTGNNLLPINGIHPNVRASHKELIKKKDRRWIGKDILKMTKSILQEPPDAASYMAYSILGKIEDVGGRVVRMNPLVQPIFDKPSNQWVLPSGLTAEKFAALAALEMDAVSQHEVDLIVEFGKLWIANSVVNQSLRYDEYFKTQIGQGTFELAKDHWAKIY